MTVRRSRGWNGGTPDPDLIVDRQRAADGKPLRVRLRGAGESWDRSTSSAAKRATLIQCDRCSCVATGFVNTRGVITGVNLRADHAAAAWTHAGCGGHLALYDIADGAS